jgi:hypothetical protein
MHVVMHVVAFSTKSPLARTLYEWPLATRKK